MTLLLHLARMRRARTTEVRLNIGQQFLLLDFYSLNDHREM